MRALSPGVNDPYTALGCIDYLGAMICRIADREFPAEHLYDENKDILITYKLTTFEGIVCAAFDQIRQHSLDNAAVLIRLLEVLHITMERTEDSRHRDVLHRQAIMAHRAGMENIPEEFDRQDLQERFRLIQTLVEHGKD